MRYIASRLVLITLNAPNRKSKPLVQKIALSQAALKKI
jgi:hypothetical protein